MNVGFFSVEDSSEKPLVRRNNYKDEENERLKEQMHALVLLVMAIVAAVIGFTRGGKVKAQ